MKKILSICALATVFILNSASFTISANDELCGDTQCSECEFYTVNDELWMSCPVYDSTGARVGYKASRVKFGGGTTGS